MNNPVVPYLMLQPTSGQQAPTDYVIAPMQHHMIPTIHNYPNGEYTSQKSQRITSTSEEEEETKYNSKNVRQVIRRTERKEMHRTQNHTTPPKEK
jgi:hypothetical protein